MESIDNIKQKLNNYESYLKSNYVAQDISLEIRECILILEQSLTKRKINNDNSGIDSLEERLLLEYISYIKSCYFKEKTKQKSNMKAL